MEYGQGNTDNQKALSDTDDKVVGLMKNGSFVMVDRRSPLARRCDKDLGM